MSMKQNLDPWRMIAFDDLTDEDCKAMLQAMGRAAGWEDPEATVFDDLRPEK